jgi:hypothetical protein
MRVRVFLPADETLEQFPFGEFEFDVMPLEGQILRFTDLEDADYPIEQVGFIQDGESFVGAVWLGPPRPRSGSLEGSAELDEEAIP